MLEKQVKKQRRAKRVRTKAKAGNRPRLSVFRSNQHIYLQLVDDEQGKTLVGSSDLEVKKKKLSKLAKVLPKTAPRP